MKRMMTFALVVVLSGLFGLAGCKGKESTTAPAKDTAKKTAPAADNTKAKSKTPTTQSESR